MISTKRNEEAVKKIYSDTFPFIDHFKCFTFKNKTKQLNLQIRKPDDKYFIAMWLNTVTFLLYTISIIINDNYHVSCRGLNEKLFAQCHLVF